MVEEVGDLRRLNLARIAKELRTHNCDPEVAIMAAWYVFHNYHCKRYASLYNGTLSAMNKIKAWERIHPRIVDLIMTNYAQSFMSKNPTSLLPGRKR